jgi:glycyl-tRNA synthetase alpha chain
VVLKPAPEDGRDLFLGSLAALGLDPSKCDLRFEAVEMELSPLDSIGAGTAVRLSGMEVARIGYLQRMGGYDLDPVGLSIACGLERLALAVTGAADVFDLDWSPNVRYADLYRRREIEFSRYQYEEADPAVLVARFDDAEREARRLLDSRLVLPAYDLLLRCAHVFQLIRARAAGGASATTDMTGRIRTLARACCKGWIESASLEEMQFHANP